MGVIVPDWMDLAVFDRVGGSGMRKLKVLVVAAAFLSVPFLGAARPASAMRCDESIETACRVVATVVCKVVAKGQPCLA